MQQSTQCFTALAPDYEQITDLKVRKAIAYAYPYESNWLAIGEVPGVTRVPANSIMPPGMVGKPDYYADGEQFTFNPTKSKELLAEAGYEPGEYELTLAYYEPDDLAVAGYNQVKKGYEEGGFKVRGIPIQDSPFDLYADPDNKINKELNIRHVNWCSDWPSGAHHAGAAGRDGRGVQLRPLLRAVRGRRDRPDPDAAARRAGRRLGRAGREDRHRVPAGHPDGVTSTTCTCSARRSATPPATVPSGRRTSRTSTSLTDRRRGTPTTHETGPSLPSRGWPQVAHAHPGG